MKFTLFSLVPIAFLALVPLTNAGLIPPPLSLNPRQPLFDDSSVDDPYLAAVTQGKKTSSLHGAGAAEDALLAFDAEQRKAALSAAIEQGKKTSTLGDAGAAKGAVEAFVKAQKLREAAERGKDELKQSKKGRPPKTPQQKQQAQEYQRRWRAKKKAAEQLAAEQLAAEQLAAEQLAAEHEQPKRGPGRPPVYQTPEQKKQASLDARERAEQKRKAKRLAAQSGQQNPTKSGGNQGDIAQHPGEDGLGQPKRTGRVPQYKTLQQKREAARKAVQRSRANKKNQGDIQKQPSKPLTEDQKKKRLARQRERRRRERERKNLEAHQQITP